MSTFVNLEWGASTQRLAGSVISERTGGCVRRDWDHVEGIFFEWGRKRDEYKQVGFHSLKYSLSNLLSGSTLEGAGPQSENT